MWVLWLLFVGYLLLWAGLWTHCLLRKRFYPVLTPGGATKVFWLVTFLLFNPILTLLYLVFGVFAKPKETAEAVRWLRAVIVALVVVVAVWQLWPGGWREPGVIRFMRDAKTGEVVTSVDLPDDVRSSHLATTQSHSSFSSTSTSGGQDSDAFAHDKAIILNQSDEPLLKQVSIKTAAALSEAGWFDELIYYPAAESPPILEPGADLMIGIDAGRLTESGLPGAKTLQGAILITAGRKPWMRSIGGSHTYTNKTPPIADVEWKGTFDFTISIKGYAPAEKRQQMWANQISQEITKTLNKQLENWTEKFAPLIDLPDSFIPAYEPPGEVPFADHPNCHQIVSQNWILRPNETFWRLDDERDSETVLTWLHDQLLLAGWEPEGHGLYLDKSKGENALNMKKGNCKLWAFQPRKQDCGIDEQSDQSPPYFIGYIQTADDAKFCNALEDLLASGPSADQIIQFQRMAHMCPNNLRDRFLDRLDVDGTTSIDGLLTLAHHFHQKGDLDTARKAARRARVLSQALGERNVNASLKKMAEKLDDPTLTDKEIGAKDLTAMNLPRLKPPAFSIEQPADVGEAVLVCWMKDEKEPILLAARITRTRGAKGKARYQLKLGVCESHGHVSSMTSSLSTFNENQVQGRSAISHNHATFVASARSAGTGSDIPFMITIELGP